MRVLEHACREARQRQAFLLVKLVSKVPHACCPYLLVDWTQLQCLRACGMMFPIEYM